MKLLVATDFSAAARAMGEVAAAWAGRLGAELVLVHAVEGPVLRAQRARLDEEERGLRAPGAEVRSVVESGSVAGVVAGAAMAERAELVVIGAQGEGRRRLLGGAAAAILRRVPTAVLVVRAPERLRAFGLGERLRALLALSLEGDEAPVRQALGLLARIGPIDADLVHYRYIPPARGPVFQAEDVWQSLQPFPEGAAVAQVLVRDCFGRMDTHIADLARERGADLVICGSHRRHGLDRIQEGSIAEGVVRHAPVSVLVAPREQGR